MTWVVYLPKRLVKEISKLPQEIQHHLESLIDDLEVAGPTRGDWPNYSKLSNGHHHCHLSYSHVAVWFVTDKKIKLIEVTYVGSRKDTPY
ncbi:hypothetical protein [Pseudobdellovibrio exovorus]|uniref:Cytotoxic translational repressor of toxin-antitoxin stability system n=1 Tax=Pseudobdellovibrio exovorus JSS TaxID=1184267 RepID=M4VBD0_9BACT|nr:hypothetical protein [Pseudobdellovibrio exovorus]AGH96498.1 hypothetical protein A11Q_2282 [Pseudobdellovibrio exovorus JSS]